MQKESSLGDLQRKLDEARKGLKAKHKAEQDAMAKRNEEARIAMSSWHEQRRKDLQVAQDEELSAFVAKQEEARKKIVSKHKSIEKTNEEEMRLERTQFEAALKDNLNLLNSKHEVPRQQAILQNGKDQSEMDVRQLSARQRMTNELQKQRTEFMRQQQLDRDDVATTFRRRITQLVEQAQNEFSRALLGKACVLLSGPPASGKSVLMSQLLMHTLGDGEATLTPILIRVQELHRLLAHERAELATVRSSATHSAPSFPACTPPPSVHEALGAHHRRRGAVCAVQVRAKLQQLREPLQAKHKLERDKAPPDQLTSLDERHAREAAEVADAEHETLSAVYKRCAFANAWNWIDAYLRCVHGAGSSAYAMLRQAMVARRALILLDGMDEGGEAREAIETHVLEVLAPQVSSGSNSMLAFTSPPCTRGSWPRLI